MNDLKKEKRMRRRKINVDDFAATMEKKGLSAK